MNMSASRARSHLIQNMIITEVPVDFIHMSGYFVLVEKAGNELEVGVVTGKLHGNSPKLLEEEADGEEP